MIENLAWAALVFGILTVALQSLLLLRKPRFETPADLAARLGLIKQQLQSLTQSGTRTEAGNERIEGKLEQRLDAQRTDLEARLASLQKTIAAELDGSRQALDAKLALAQEDARAGRGELGAAFAALESRLEHRIGGFDQSMSTRFDTLQQGLLGRLEASGGQIQKQFGLLQEAVAQQLSAMAQGSQHNSEQLRGALNERLAAIQADNTAKLEEMRRTVDEKLHATLEQRLGDSFKLVSERLEQVHVGLGEMKSLAGSVGDLKRVMTNVRTRGTWGEVQLGAIIESLLIPEQYAQNVKTVPGRNELVEYAIKMPGNGPEASVWLPIDSKYPVEHYQRLIDAHEAADKEQIQKAVTAFESSLRLEAKKIREKYVSPPNTTDFAILFVPTEGLFAEVCRIPGMVEALQNDFRVVVAGPTTLAAMLNSLRLGFRTLAIEKRSSEVWSILSGVKSEFQKFGVIVDATHKSIDSAAKKFSEIGVRTRAIERKLRGVEELPASAAAEPDAIE